jgi:hypothetical protein
MHIVEAIDLERHSEVATNSAWRLVLEYEYARTARIERCDLQMADQSES